MTALEYQCAGCGRRFLHETGDAPGCPHCGAAETVIAVEEEDD